MAGAPAAGGADVAALEARLKQLEAEAKRREEDARRRDAAAGTPPAQDFQVRADNWLVGRRILDREVADAEACRRQCKDDARCVGYDFFATEKSGICRHYDDVERRDGKPGWRSGVKPEWASRPRADGAGSGPAPAQGFVVRLDQRIAGEAMAAPPSTANCESRCRTETGCVAWSLSKQGVCELFRSVDRLYEDRQWRSGVRSDRWAQLVAAAPASPVPRADPMPPVEPKAGRGDGAASGLTLDDNVRIDGNGLGEAVRAASPDACRQRCAETTGCIAFQHGKRSPVMGQCHLFDRVDRRQADPAWRSGVAR